ncbi:cation diffusion facilitator family transporter [Halorussus salilacus]|uniref:cation diffusion facilitator family transporter n=1 Tax=Halorussus salilacus TaxID=2953750 RepID=UPI0020A15086|nr:cation diffusion facilitator family transporter [Halorussus salilacus]USZ67328.1 cation diffusion facilitator family transporter [Halorussus salilacus]
MTDDRASFVRASWVNVVSNVLKIAVEGALGVFSGSLALVADAAHSLADLLASAVVLVWGRSSFDGPDETHPHGHHRFEPLTALFVGGVLVLLGFKLLYDAGRSLAEGSEARYGALLVVGLGFALANRVACYWYTKRTNRDLDSPGLRALAADSLNDVYTTLAAFAGVAGMALGYPVLDPVAGGLVSALVVRQGVEISRENIDYLVDRAPPEAHQERIRSAIRDHPEVHGIHDFAAYYTGNVVEVEFHAEIGRGHSLVEAHEIETELRSRVREVEAVEDVHIHLDPAGLGEWKDADERGLSHPSG